jgi:hypothetical protein
MDVNELYELRKFIVRASNAQRYHGESIASDQYMSWIRDLYYVDNTMIRQSLRRGVKFSISFRYIPVYFYCNMNIRFSLFNISVNLNYEFELMNDALVRNTGSAI